MVTVILGVDASSMPHRYPAGVTSLPEPLTEAFARFSARTALLPRTNPVAETAAGRGKVLRIDPAAVNPQGAAGNGVAGVKLSAGDPMDTVIAALALTCENGEAILSISEKGWKVPAARPRR